NLIYEIGEGERWLVDSGTDKGYTPLPLWDEYDIADGIDRDTKILPGSINLLRSLARVDVVADEDANFELTEVWVFNSKSNGLIIPEPGKVVDGVAVLPSMPVGGPTNNSSPLGYQTAGENLVGEIY